MTPPGLPAERTRLAWRRTTLTATIAVLLGGSAALNHRLAAPAVAVVALLALPWLGVLAVAFRRITALTRGEVVAATSAPALLALLTVLLAALAGVLVLLLFAGSGG